MNIPSATIRVTVIASSGIERTWFVPKALLLRQSLCFQAACKDPCTNSIALHHGSLPAFQNLIDFVHSSIYSPNRNASDYHCIGTHLEAWALGKKLEAKTYQLTALRNLYAWVEPLARMANGSIGYSPIRVEDIKFVSENMEQGEVVRAMIYDAVAAHCMQADASAIADALGTPSGDIKESKGAPSPAVQSQIMSKPHAPWVIELSKCDDFCKRISSSRMVTDENRSRLLRPIDEYLAGKVIPKEEEFRQQRANEQASMLFARSGSSQEIPQRRAAQIDGRHMRSPSRGRGSSASSTGSETARRALDEHQPSEDDDYMTEDGEFVRLNAAKTKAS